MELDYKQIGVNIARRRKELHSVSIIAPYISKINDLRNVAVISLLTANFIRNCR